MSIQAPVLDSLSNMGGWINSSLGRSAMVQETLRIGVYARVLSPSLSIAVSKKRLESSPIWYNVPGSHLSVAMDFTMINATMLLY
jgi:hypothetical protein